MLPLRFTEEVTTAHQIAILPEFHLLLENQLLVLSYEFPKSSTISKIIHMELDIVTDMLAHSLESDVSEKWNFI